MLFDHPVAWLPLDHPLHVRRLVAGRDDEASRVAPDPLVLRDRERPNPLQAEWVRTLTDQAIKEFGIVSPWRKLLSDLRDALVHLTEHSLIFGQPS